MNKIIFSLLQRCWWICSRRCSCWIDNALFQFSVKVKASEARLDFAFPNSAIVDAMIILCVVAWISLFVVSSANEIALNGQSVQVCFEASTAAKNVQRFLVFSAAGNNLTRSRRKVSVAHKNIFHCSIAADLCAVALIVINKSTIFVVRCTRIENIKILAFKRLSGQCSQTVFVAVIIFLAVQSVRKNSFSSAFKIRLSGFAALTLDTGAISFTRCRFNAIRQSSGATKLCLRMLT